MSVPATGRVQLALNVSDLDSSIEFYERLLGSPPAKRKPGYANFAVDEPPLKLVLIEAANGSAGGTINHLGVEVTSTEVVEGAARRFELDGLATDVEEGVTCCYAVQDKVWVTAPDGERWEYYAVLDDADAMTVTDTATACCADRAHAHVAN